MQIKAAKYLENGSSVWYLRYTTARNFSKIKGSAGVTEVPQKTEVLQGVKEAGKTVEFNPESIG